MNFTQLPTQFGVCHDNLDIYWNGESSVGESAQLATFAQSWSRLRKDERSFHFSKAFAEDVIPKLSEIHVSGKFK